MKNISNWLKPVLCFCLSFIVLAFGSCTEDDVHYTYDLQITDSSYIFPVDGGDFTVTVTTDHPDGWNAEYTEAEWISKSDETSTAITFTASPNLTGDMPELKVKFTAGTITKELTLIQQPKIADENVNFFMFSSSIQAISPDGTLVVFYEIEGSTDEGNRVVRYYTVNTQTDEKTLMLESYDGSELVISVRAVSNNGIMLGELVGGGLSNDVIIRNGAIEYPNFPSGNWNYPSLVDISADGTIIVGGATDGSNTSRAIKWVNGEPEILSAPTGSRLYEGDGIRETRAQAISPDGTFIMGRAINYSSVNEGIYWKDGGQWQWLGEMITKEVEIIWGGETMIEEYDFVALVGTNSQGQISPNNRYAAIIFQDWGLSRWQFPSKVDVPALFDIENEEIVEILDVVDNSPNGATPITALNDGSICYRYINYITGITPTFLYKDNVHANCQAYLEGLFGTLIGPDVEIMKISEDPLVAVGSFKHPAGIVVPFYIRPVTTN